MYSWYYVVFCLLHLFRKTQVIPIHRIGFILIGNPTAILLALMYRAMSKRMFLQIVSI